MVCVFVYPWRKTYTLAYTIFPAGFTVPIGNGMGLLAHVVSVHQTLASKRRWMLLRT